MHDIHMTLVGFSGGVTPSNASGRETPVIRRTDHVGRDESARERVVTPAGWIVAGRSSSHSRRYRVPDATRERPLVIKSMAHAWPALG